MLVDKTLLLKEYGDDEDDEDHEDDDEEDDEDFDPTAANVSK